MVSKIRCPLCLSSRRDAYISLFSRKFALFLFMVKCRIFSLKAFDAPGSVAAVFAGDDLYPDKKEVLLTNLIQAAFSFCNTVRESITLYLSMH